MAKTSDECSSTVAEAGGGNDASVAVSAPYVFIFLRPTRAGNSAFPSISLLLNSQLTDHLGAMNGFALSASARVDNRAAVCGTCWPRIPRPAPLRAL